MGMWSRLFGRTEKRALTKSNVPFDRGGYSQGEFNTARALSLVPVWSCIRLIADSAASLPLQAYRKTSDGSRVPMANLPQLLQSPSVRNNLMQWVHQAVLSLALRGNAYGLITERDGFGFPINIEWLNPDEVHVDETRPTLPVYYWRGQVIPTADVVHIPWMTLPGSVVGLSPISAFANTIGVGLAATQYGQSWFENGGTPPATFQNTQQTVSTEEAEEIRDRTVRAMRSRKPLVFGNDWKFEALQVNPEESQFIDTMKLNATQIAAIWGVPAEMASGERGSMTYQNVEQEQIYFVQFTLRPWLVRLEAALSALLPNKQYVKFNVDALIRTDIKTRYDTYQVAHQIGLLSLDEMRALEDRPPLPDGQGASYGPEPATTIKSLTESGVPALPNGGQR